MVILTYLDISANAAAVDIIADSGRLPKWIQKCTNLQYLIGGNLALSGLDDWVSESLLQLRVLRLPNNNITTWPDHLAKLLPYEQITVVDLEGNPCFLLFCERCPSFATEYGRAAGYISKSSTSSLRKSKLKNNLVKDDGSDENLKRLSMISMTPPSSSIQAKKKSSFFFSSSRSKKPKRKGEPSSSDEQSVSRSPDTPSFSTTPMKTALLRHYDSDDSSDDEMLTSLAPAIPSLVKNTGSRNSILSLSTSITASVNSQESMNPDKWAHKRIEKSEIEKSKVLLNLLRDVWELSTRDIIKPSTGAKLVAVMTKANRPPAPLSRVASVASQPTSESSTFSNLSASPPELQLPDLTPTSSCTKRKLSIQSRLNSLDLLEQYLDKENTDSDTPTIVPPDRTEIIALLTKVVDDEKKYVQHLNELMTIYVHSKKRPAKTAKLFICIPIFYQLHSSIMLSSLKRCLKGYETDKDPNLNQLAELVMTHEKELRVYIEYEMAIEESLRLVQFWKRITALEANQPSMQYGGAALPHMVSYRHPDAYIAEWIQTCMANKSHSLRGIAEYLQTPVEQLELYRYMLSVLSTLTPELKAAHEMFEKICAEIEREKPKAAELRRMAEFEHVYNMGTLLASNKINNNNPEGDPNSRRYLGDAIVLLKSEVRLELPSRTFKVPDAIHYMSNHNTPVPSSVDLSSSSASPPTDNPTEGTEITNAKLNADAAPTTAPTTPTNNTTGRPWKSNPVPKVLTKRVHKIKFTLPLYRIIICTDIIIITEEDKKKVVKVLDRRQISASLPWKYPVRDSGADALPTGDKASIRSKASSIISTSTTNTITTSLGTNGNGGGASGSIRIMFHDDDPVIWNCTIRTFTSSCGVGGLGGLGSQSSMRKKEPKEPRVRMVELFEEQGQVNSRRE